MKNLNAIMENKGFSPLSENMYGIGIGGFSIHENKFIFDGYASLYFSGHEKSTVGEVTYNSSLSGSLGFYNAGYLIYSQRGINIFPVVGFGFGGMRIKIEDREKRTMQEILDNPRESTTKMSVGLLFNIALGIDKLYIRTVKNDIGRGLGFGFRIGYRTELLRTEWTNVSDGPDVFFTGPYLNLTLCGGYNRQ
ncbi:hypothetical protein ACFL60_06975 [Candidatus Omnitrophota bacterium]